MNITNVLRSISSVLSKPSDFKYQTISNETITDQLNNIKVILNMTGEIFEKLSADQKANLYEDVKSRVASDHLIVNAIGKPCASFIGDIDRKLVGKAKVYGLFESITITTRRMINMIDDLQKHSKEILNSNEGIIVGDIQMSQALLIGTIGTAMSYADFCMFMIAIFSHIVTKSTRPHIPKYMGEKILTDGDNIINLINQVVNSPNGIQVVNIIAGLKRRGADFKMTAADTIRQNFDQSVAANGGIILAVFVRFASFFSVLSNAKVDTTHDFFEWMAERKKWMENHIANIKLSLANIDRNDPEYVRILRLIVYYEDKVAEYEKKLNKYYGE